MMLSCVTQKTLVNNSKQLGVFLGVSSLALAVAITSASAQTCGSSSADVCPVVISEPVDTDIVVTTDSFRNDSTITLQSNTAGSVIKVAGKSDFSFVNNGTIQMSDTGGRPGAGDVVINPPEIDWETEQWWYEWPAAMSIRSVSEAGADKAAVVSNTGTLKGGIAAGLNSASVEFRNSGEISGLQRGQNEYNVHAVVLEAGVTFRDDASDYLIAKFSPPQPDGSFPE